MFLALTKITIGQEYDTKSFGAGVCNSFSLLGYQNSKYMAREPSILPTAFYLFFSMERHEVLAGINAYNGAKMNNNFFTNKIYGYLFNYKYFFQKKDKQLNIFTEMNIQYVQYGTGITNSVRYSYLPTSTELQPYNLIRNQSFINTIGIGARYSLFNCLGLYLVFSGGYNYYVSNYSPTNTTYQNIYKYSVDTNAKPVIQLKLGLSYKIIRKKHKD